MKPETLELLTCPACHGGLRLRGEASESIESGSLVCNTCSKEFPIEEGIPHFIRYDELTGLNRRFARLYDWFSYVYVPYSKIAFAFIGGEDTSRREVLDRLAPTDGKVLEVSIGPGFNLPYLLGAPGVLRSLWIGHLAWTASALPQLLSQARLVGGSLPRQCRRTAVRR